MHGYETSLAPHSIHRFPSVFECPHVLSNAGACNHEPHLIDEAEGKPVFHFNSTDLERLEQVRGVK